MSTQIQVTKPIAIARKVELAVDPTTSLGCLRDTAFPDYAHHHMLSRVLRVVSRSS